MDLRLCSHFSNCDQLDKIKQMQFQQTLLVVDDNGGNRLLPGLILRPLGFTVLECSSGREAIDVLSRMPVGGVLLDIQMPGLSGLDVLECIRADAIFGQTRVIAYTGFASSQDVDFYFSRGFDGVLLKPIRSSDLLKILNK